MVGCWHADDDKQDEIKKILTMNLWKLPEKS